MNDELRKAIEGIWAVGGRDAADQVLALPEIAALRTKADAADRVRALCADALDRAYASDADVLVSDVRNALDGDQS